METGRRGEGGEGEEGMEGDEVEAVEGACHALAGTRRPFPSNIAKVLGLSPPRTLAITPPETARRHITELRRLLNGQGRLVLLAQMFGEYRSDNLMRELCRLAIKCAREGLVGA